MKNLHRASVNQPRSICAMVRTICPLEVHSPSSLTQHGHEISSHSFNERRRATMAFGAHRTRSRPLSRSRSLVLFIRKIYYLPRALTHRASRIWDGKKGAMLMRYHSHVTIAFFSSFLSLINRFTRGSVALTVPVLSPVSHIVGIGGLYGSLSTTATTLIICRVRKGTNEQTNNNRNGSNI